MEPVERLSKIPVWEILTHLNERSSLGRVVINPPGRMAPLIPHPTGEEWFFCKKCGYACISREKMFAHREKHLQDSPSDGDEDDDDDQTEVIGSRHDSDDDLALEFKDDIINKKRDHFECGICRKMLVTLKGLRNHHLVHQNLRPEKCKTCGAGFSRKTYLDKHIRRSHDVSFQNCCKFCPCRFETEQGLRKHLSFYHDSSLEDGKRDLQSEEAINQNVEQKLARKSAFIKPLTLRKYTNSIKIKFSFPGKYSLQTRTDRSIVLKAIQQNSRIFECHVCGRACASRSSLNGHIRIHTGEKPFTCTKCGAKFRSTAAQRKHLQSTHGNGAFGCYYCSCKLATEWVRRMHCFRYHPDEIDLTSTAKLADEIHADQQYRQED